MMKRKSLIGLMSKGKEKEGFKVFTKSTLIFIILKEIFRRN